MHRTSVGNGEGKAMKTVVIGVVVALHCVALGTLLMTQGCGTTRGSDGPVQFQDKPAVLPKPVSPDMMPEKVAKPAKPIVKIDDEDILEKPLPPKKDVKKDVKPAVAASKSYTVKSGDSVGYIAQRFKITTAEIKELNPSIKNIAKIREGQIIKLPSYVDLSAPAPKRHTKPKPVVAADKPAVQPMTGSSTPTFASAGEYVIVAGDYPEKIAKKLGVKMDDLMKANKISDPKKLKIGQKLVVPGATQAAPPSMPMVPVDPMPIAPLPAFDTPTSAVPGVAPVAPLAPMTPSVSTGMAPVAPVAPVVPGGIVEPAGELRPLSPAPGPVPGAPGAVKAPVMQPHLVAPGETLKDIAMLYTVTVADIMKANGMTTEAVAPGQKLNIPPAQ
jgi:LysM repeat protein